MRIENRGVDAKISSGVEGSTPSTFKIVTNSASFDTLSKKLYNDPIRAVIRELSCNAWDAHAAAGKKNIPFEVHLPTRLEPWFTVTDFGTGLKFIKGGCSTCNGTGMVSADVLCTDCDATGDYDAAKRLYCTYFASDKQNTDDFIGGFGLGSKSPFAYTNKEDDEEDDGGFTVTNHYNGQTFNYSAMVLKGKDADGNPDGTSFPTVSLQDILDTPDTPNGVEVTFPVDPSDVWEFENTATSVFEFFQPRPKLNLELDITTPEYSVQDELWGMRKEEGTLQGSGLRAIQGNVQYSVGNIDVSRLSATQQKLVNLPIDLFFNVGELQPAAPANLCS